MTMENSQQPVVPDTGVPPTPAADETSPNLAESGVPATTAETPPAPAINWDDAANPHRYAAQQAWQTVQALQAQIQQLTTQQTADQLRKQGYTDEQIGAAISMQQREAALAQREASLQEQARAPVAFELARRITEQMGVKIDASELLTTSLGAPIVSPEAMVARADALIMERRKDAMAKRQATGSDKVGKTGSAAPPVDPNRYKGMKPAQIIAAGLRKLSNQ